MKTVARFQESFAANLAKTILNDEGIQAEILGDTLMWSVGVTNTTALALQLVVSDDDFERSLSLLKGTPISENCYFEK